MTYLATKGKNSPALHNFTGLGLEIHFQDGPIGEYGINGTTNEEVIHVLIERIESLQAMDRYKYACHENSSALTHLAEALNALEARTYRRIQRNVEGKSEP